MTKQPSHSGERPLADSTPDSGQKPFDPSHFGKHEFPLGLREELIKAEKPRIDPKFLQDTVPPNRKPVLTEPEHPATTPRGGFAAPKPRPTVDRDAPTLIATPLAKPPEAPTLDAVTLVKVPTVKAPQTPATNPTDSPSAPPVDTSRTDPTIILPGIRKNKDNRGLVIGIVAGLALLFAVGLLIRPGTQPDTAPTPPAKVATTPPPLREPASAAEPPAPTPTQAPAVTATPSAPSAEESAAPPNDTHKDKSRTPKASSKTAEPKVSPPALPKPAPAPNAAGKQPWIDGL
jgi:hypothetical protein